MVEGSVFDEKDVAKRIELEVGINKTIHMFIKGRLIILSYTKGLSNVKIVLCEKYIGEKGYLCFSRLTVNCTFLHNYT